MTKRVISTTSFLLLGALGAFSLAGCSAESAVSAVSADCVPSHDVTTVTAGTLSVGVPENLPYTKTEGTDADGFEIALIRKLADSLCLDLAFTPITYANGIPLISQQKQLDIITGGWYVTESRAEQVGFTSPTYYDSMAIISVDGIDTISGLESIGSVGSVAGFAWESDMIGILGDDLKTYPSTIETKADMVSGRLVAALDGFAVANYAYSDTDYTVEVAQPDDRVAITTEAPVIAFPVSRDNVELSDALSELIDGFREDGTLAAILVDWDLPETLVIPADAAATSIR